MSHRPLARMYALAAALALPVIACSDPTSAPARSPASLSAVKFWDAGSSVAWNQIAREVNASRGGGTPITQSRLFAYLSIAQYNAIVAAGDAGGRASPAAAAAGASVVYLKSFFPLDHALIESRLVAQKAQARWPGEQTRDVAAGEAIGRAIGAAVAAYAASDGTGLTPLPVNPRGPGNWTGAASIPGLYGARPLTLDRGDQFRPVPPPAIDSPEFIAALQEIHDLSAGRTAEQLAIAQRWASQGAAFLNTLASAMIVSHRRTEIEAARTLALANMAVFDATIGCFDGKLAYYLIRPSQIDPTITLPVGLPNHPSYPSGHSCQTASFVTVLASVFPSERASLEGLIVEAGLSRMYGGLHYRFDCDAGQELGRQVAAWVLANAPRGHEAIPLD